MTALYICLGVAAGAALIAAFFLFSNNCLTVTRFVCRMEGGHGRRIAHLSDLHGKNFGRDNIRLIKKVAAQKPDIIAITGDIIHRYTPKNIETALKTVSALREIAPVYYVSGNHEMRNMGYRFFRKQLREAGAEVLDDRAVDCGDITITGLNGASLKNNRIFALAERHDTDILLAHEPQLLEKYAKAGFGLVLCGHAHGGQWRIPFTKIGLYAPSQGVFPKYTAGRYDSGGTTMIVSRGLGNSEFPLRLFNRPEIVIIDI